MSRDVVPEAVLAGAGAVLLALVLAAVSRGARPGRGAVVTGLVYPLLVAPGAVAAGATLPVLLGLAVVLLLPVVAARAAARRTDRPGGDAGRAAALARAAVAAGLVVVVLSAAGQSVALLGRVDARTTVVLIGATGAAVALVGGLVGTSHLGRWAALLLLPSVAIVLAAGIMLGSPGDLLDPAVTVAGPSATQWLAWALALAALGWADPALDRAVGPATGAQVVRIGVLLLGLVLASGLGLLLLLGGTVVGPSMQLFVLPANVGVVPGPVLVVLLGVVLAAVAMVAALLAAAGAGLAPAGTPTPAPAPGPVLVVAAVGVVGATLTASVESVAVVAALLAAAVAGAEAVGWVRGPARRPAHPGLVAGTGAALVAAVALAVSGQLTFGGTAVVALCVVAAVAAAAQARGGRRAPVTARPGDQR